MLPSAERDHRIGCWLAAAAFAVVVWLVVGSIRALDKPLRIVTLPGTRVYYYLTPETGDFTAESFEVTGRGILVHQGSLLFELRRPAGSWDAVLEPFLVTERLDELDRFTVDAGGVILVVRHDSLLQVTGSGALAPIARLPRWRMKPAPSREPGFAYLLSGGIFDLDDEDDLYTVGLPGSVFLLSDHDGGVRRVVRLDSPPVALSEGVDGYYLALEGGELIQVLGARKRLVFTFPRAARGAFDRLGESPIRSVAATDDPRLVFFSTRTTVYALVGGAAVPVTRGLGGQVRWRDGVLFVLDPSAGFLVGIDRLPAALGLN